VGTAPQLNLGEDIDNGCAAVVSDTGRPTAANTNLMDIKGQQAEHKEDKRQIPLSVAEVVFEVIALVFKRVEGFVFDFPTPRSPLTGVTILF
jgi:hypothetical protein